MLKLRHELAIALRTLARQPAFVASAVLSLALAIALNTTMFSVLEALVAPRVDIREPERLYRVVLWGDSRRFVDPKLRDQIVHDASARVADEVTHYTFGTRFSGFSPSAAYRGRVTKARILSVAPNYFETLGLRATHGRLFSAATEATDGGAVIVGEGLSRRLMPELESPIGQSITIDGTSFTVVGMLPVSADRSGVNADLWVLPPTGSPPHWTTLVRLKPGTTGEEAERLFGFVAERVETASGLPPQTLRFTFRPAFDQQFHYKGFHLALIGAVLAVLLVACANLANLQLVRGFARSRELATRVALGASRRDIVRHLVAESAVVVGAGLAAGIALTFWGMHLLRVTVPPSVAEYVVEPQVSSRMFGFAAVVAGVCLVLVGVAPGLYVSRVDANTLLKRGAGTGQSARARRQYAALVIVEIALALAVTSGASLLLRAAYRVQSAEFGYDTKPVSVAVVVLRADSSTSPRPLLARIEAMVARASTINGVQRAAAARSGVYQGHGVTVDDPGGARGEVGMGLSAPLLVTPEYLRVFAIPIVRGRDFLEGERGEPAVIVSDAMAKKLWPNSDPIGRRMKLGTPESGARWLRVVGVASPSTPRRLDARLPAGIGDRGWRVGNVWVLDTGGVLTEKGETIRVVTRAAAHSDPAQIPPLLAGAQRDEPYTRLFESSSWESWIGIDGARESQSFVAALFVIFALTSLVLAALGVYSVSAYAVARRHREFGVRLALGAEPRRLLLMVLREGNVLALGGIAAGLVLAAMGSRLLRGFIDIENDIYDAWVFAVAGSVLLAAALVAALVPAIRAARTDPSESLRSD